MAGVMADQGQVRGMRAPGGNHLKVTPENVLALAEAFRYASDRLDSVWYGSTLASSLSPDSFLGDPHSKWAIEVFNSYFFDGLTPFVRTLEQLTVEHKRTFNALKAIAESYGKTDEWNAHDLGEAYQLS